MFIAQLKNSKRLDSNDSFYKTYFICNLSAKWALVFGPGKPFQPAIVLLAGKAKSLRHDIQHNDIQHTNT